MGYFFYFFGFSFLFCVTIVLEVVKEGFVSSATKTTRACRASQREMGIIINPEQIIIGHGGRTLANTGKACTHMLTSNLGRIKRKGRIDFFLHNKIDVLTIVGQVSYFETNQPGV
jgi:hypothetical protein